MTARLAATVTNDPDKEDQALFRASIKGVRRLRQRKPPPHRTRIAPVPRKTLEDENRVREELLTHEPDPAEMEVGDELVYARPGLQHGVMRKLRRGQFVIGAELDMHGMTVPVARRELNAFLARSIAAETGCVRVIHGKGLSTPNRMPVLKARVNAWLQHSNDVLAFCSARPYDGGTGALYVLLRKRR
ncbi:MAG: Smr/MutS family protein [Gammaproteobacteria bacterium]